MRVKYKGFKYKEQHTWAGGSNPEGVLEVGKEYTLYDEEVHSWHTRFYLKEFPDRWFNSALFERIEE